MECFQAVLVGWDGFLDGMADWYRWSWIRRMEETWFKKQRYFYWMDKEGDVCRCQGDVNLHLSYVTEDVIVGGTGKIRIYPCMDSRNYDNMFLLELDQVRRHGFLNTNKNTSRFSLRCQVWLCKSDLIVG